MMLRYYHNDVYHNCNITKIDCVSWLLTLDEIIINPNFWIDHVKQKNDRSKCPHNSEFTFVNCQTIAGKVQKTKNPEICSSKCDKYYFQIIITSSYLTFYLQLSITQTYSLRVFIFFALNLMQYICAKLWTMPYFHSKLDTS